MTKRLLTYLLLLCTSTVYGQDLHLSQFYTSPLNMNPATAGSFGGTFRLMANYKNQWKSISNPYKTTFASYDMKLFVPKRSTLNYLAAGLSFMGDKAGKSALGLMQADLDVAYNIKIKKYQYFSAGIRTGFAQRSITFANLKWDKQFDGNAYDPNLSNGQSTLGETTKYLDLGSGVEYKYIQDKSKFKLNLGFSAFHLHQPRQSFIGNSSQRLYRKYIVHVMSQIPILRLPYYIVPQFIYSLQGPYRELVAGAHFRYVFGMDTEGAILNTYSLSSTYVQAGVLYRAGDAIIIIASVELKKALSFGISYDFNISKLKVASHVRGGIELSLSYRGAFTN